jgi:hypothetical protein
MSVILAICVVLLIAGCGKGPSVATYPVTGRVIYHDAPVAGATVSYLPDDNSAPRAVGVTDAEGRFDLTTFVSSRERLAGAMSGKYRVTIVKQSTPAWDVPEVNLETASDDERAKAMQDMWRKENERAGSGSAGAMQVRSEIPTKYAQTSSSDLVADVIDGENPPVEFKLSD